MALSEPNGSPAKNCLEGERAPGSWRRPGKSCTTKRWCVQLERPQEARQQPILFFSGSKLIAELFIDKILRHTEENNIRRPFPGKKPVLQFNSAPAHFTEKTVAWLESNNINYMKKEDWMGNSPDLSPIDYGINGIFRYGLRKRNVMTIERLVRVAKRLYRTFPCGVPRKLGKAGWIGDKNERASN